MEYSTIIGGPLISNEGVWNQITQAVTTGLEFEGRGDGRNVDM
jgi:hypothetical protein